MRLTNPTVTRSSQCSAPGHWGAKQLPLPRVYSSCTRRTLPEQRQQSKSLHSHKNSKGKPTRLCSVCCSDGPCRNSTPHPAQLLWQQTPEGSAQEGSSITPQLESIPSCQRHHQDKHPPHQAGALLKSAFLRHPLSKNILIIFSFNSI